MELSKVIGDKRRTAKTGDGTICIWRKPMCKPTYLL